MKLVCHSPVFDKTKKVFVTTVDKTYNVNAIYSDDETGETIYLIRDDLNQRHEFTEDSVSTWFNKLD